MRHRATLCDNVQESIRAEFGIGDSGVEFVPYWENRLQTGDGDSAVSLYRKQDRALVIVSNLERKARTVRVRCTLPGVRSVRNAETGAPVELRDGVLSLEIPRNDFAVLFINN